LAAAGRGKADVRAQTPPSGASRVPAPGAFEAAVSGPDPGRTT